MSSHTKPCESRKVPTDWKISEAQGCLELLNKVLTNDKLKCGDSLY